MTGAGTRLLSEDGMCLSEQRGGRVLLPAGSEDHEVLQTGSIHVAILPSCQCLYNSTF